MTVAHGLRKRPLIRLGFRSPAYKGPGSKFYHKARAAVKRAYSLQPADWKKAPTFEGSAVRRRHSTGLFKGLADIIYGYHQRPAVSSSVYSVRRKGSMWRKRKKRRYGSHNAMHVAKTALSKVRKLERKQEVKFFDNAVTNIATVNSTGDIRSLALIGEGNAVNSRDGEKISPFFLKLRLNWQGVTGGTTDIYRTIVFRDLRQIEGGTPAVSDILRDTSPVSQFNTDTRGRWKILYDETFTSANDSAIRLNFVTIVNVKLTLPMTFADGLATSISKNGLYMINISNLAANLPAINYSTRLFYND